MAFFNLTQLGPQNMFKTANSCQGGDSPSAAAAPPRPSRSPQAQMPEVLLKEGASTAGSHVHVQSDGQGQVEAGSDPTSRRRESTGKEVKITSAGTAPSTSHIATYSSSSSGTRSQHGGSYTKYTELLHKHQRSPQGPMDLYRHPLTTSQMYGWWMSHEQPHRQDWAQGPRHVHVNSEMTRFVDEMSQTNKEFSLY